MLSLRKKLSYVTFGKLQYVNKTLTKEVHTHHKLKKKRRLLSRYLPISVGVVGLFGYLPWKYVSWRINPREGEFVECASPWEYTLYTNLPLKLMSRLFGAVSSISIPRFLRPTVYNFYIKTFNVKLEEYEIQDLHAYRSLLDFFVRPIRLECRPIDTDIDAITSPADGKVLTFGKITKCEVHQIKGMTYSLQHFLGNINWPVSRAVSEEGDGGDSFEAVLDDTVNMLLESPVRNTRVSKVRENNFSCNSPDLEYLQNLKQKNNTDLYQLVVYLAPGDYHRFHSPITWRVTFRRHFTGNLLSVNPAIASCVKDLFSLNERALYTGTWDHGFFSMTAVGATNVGSIKVNFDSKLETNTWFTSPPSDNVFGNSGVPLEKGDLFGEFRLGSTIVLIFEAPPDFEFDVQVGQKIKFGERVGFVK